VSQVTTSQKQPAPPRPVPSVEGSLRLSLGPARQSAAAQSHVTPQPTVTSAVPPCNNNNVTYGNSNDVNDWTDDEWDDDDEEDEEMQVSNCCNFLLFVLHVFYSGVYNTSIYCIGFSVKR